MEFKIFNATKFEIAPIYQYREESGQLIPTKVHTQGVRFPLKKINEIDNNLIIPSFELKRTGGIHTSTPEEIENHKKFFLTSLQNEIKEKKQQLVSYGAKEDINRVYVMIIFQPIQFEIKDGVLYANTKLGLAGIPIEEFEYPCVSE